MDEAQSSGTDRRTFIKQAAGTVVAAGLSAKSYGRVLGANDRIHLAMCTWRRSPHSKRRSR
jgi:hypothetical protein